MKPSKKSASRSLSEIQKNPGIDQATLAGRIGYDRTTIVGVVDRLVHRGLVTPRASSSDRRAHALRATGTGSRTLRGIEPAVEAAQRTMLRGFTADESKQLLRKVMVAGNELSRAPLRAASTGAARGG